MAQPYIGEIRMFAGNFAPAGWMFCWGQIVPISEYDALFALIGTTYGGDGQATFGLPDLRGRLPMHFGGAYQMGEMAGTENITLTTQQLPKHNHQFGASTNIATQNGPASNVVAQSTLAKIYIEDIADQALAPNTILPTIGGSQPHDNTMPFLCVSFIISLFGLFPSQT